jgi:hypothetical protein
MMEDKLARVSSIGQDHIEKRSKAVISLARTQIHKFTKDHWGTVPIRWCLCFVFLGVFVGEWATNNTQMHK